MNLQLLKDGFLIAQVVGNLLIYLAEQRIVLVQVGRLEVTPAWNKTVELGSDGDEHVLDRHLANRLQIQRGNVLRECDEQLRTLLRFVSEVEISRQRCFCLLFLYPCFVFLDPFCSFIRHFLPVLSHYNKGICDKLEVFCNSLATVKSKDSKVLPET